MSEHLTTSVRTEDTGFWGLVDRVTANRWVRWVVLIAFLALLLLLPLVAEPFTNQTITRIAVFAVAVLGLNIIMGYTGQVSLGHIFFVGVGAYCAIIPIRAWWGGDLAEGSIVIGFVLALVIPGVLGLVIALAAVRLRGLALAMVTIALPIIGVPLAKRFSDITGGNEGVSIKRLDYLSSSGATLKGNPFSAPPGIGLADDQWQYYIVVVISVILFALAFFLVRGKFGRAFAIVKENEAVAASMGISPYWYKVISFTISAVFGGAAGFLYIVALQYTSSEALSFGHSIELVIATIVGGAGSIAGSFLGGVVYVLLPQLTNAVYPEATTAVQGVVILLVLFLLPGGLASLPRVIRRRTSRRRGGPTAGADLAADIAPGITKR
ncbi:MAG TPA: branched-chain amino acid ABC transporter permease [Microbacteriaceae bacterium]|nr:branched-chain amino acid ABC transporter permease [Microbacteriaceae bacterium]